MARARELTLTERARRAQLIEVTIDQVAAHGYAGTSLARIAAGAGITKAAVLYHFPAKDAVVRAAYEHVLAALVAHVGAAVDAAGARTAPGAYVRAMIGYLRDHPRHVRMIVEARIHADTGEDADGTDQAAASAARWGPLAGLLGAARADARPDGTADLDLRTLALVTGGAIDAIVAEQLADPAYDSAAAAGVLVAMLDRALAAASPPAASE